MNLNFHDLNSIADTFLKEVKNGGYDVILYGSKNYLENVWNLDYDIWLAHYTFNTSYKKDKVMWQFSNKARINGIKGNVDVNFYYGNKSTFDEVYNNLPYKSTQVENILNSQPMKIAETKEDDKNLKIAWRYENINYTNLIGELSKSLKYIFDLNRPLQDNLKMSIKKEIVI